MTIIIFDNHGFQCIRNLQESQGSQGFGNEFRFREAKTNKLSGEYLPIDFCKYAEGLGAKTFFVDAYEQLTVAMDAARNEKNSSVIVVPILPKTMSNGYQTWWRVAVAEISNSEAVSKAHQAMQEQLKLVREY